MDPLHAKARLMELLAGEDRDLMERVVDDLQVEVKALREREMRRRVIVERLMELSEVELVALLSVVLQRVSQGGTGARLLLQEMALEPSVLAHLPYERLKDAYSTAQSAGQVSVGRLFMSARLMEGQLGWDPDATDNEHLDLPLGVRRQAARTKDRLVLDRLVHDRDPRVIRNLLNNPRIMERDVVKVAAMRPTRPEVLEEVLRHRRWASSYQVRLALAFNPYTPTPVVLRLLPTLMRQDLRYGLQAGAFEGAVRDEAQLLLDQRKRKEPK